jgi:hypothetical protein
MAVTVEELAVSVGPVARVGTVEASRQLGREVLGVGRTAAVAEDDQLAARIKRLADVPGQLRGGAEAAMRRPRSPAIVEDGFRVAGHRPWPTS